MKMSEKMKAMTPEERTAWKKKMADAKASKAAARAKEGAPVVVSKNKPKPKAAAPAAPAAPVKKNDRDDGGWFW